MESSVEYRVMVIICNRRKSTFKWNVVDQKHHYKNKVHLYNYATSLANGMLHQFDDFLSKYDVYLPRRFHHCH